MVASSSRTLFTLRSWLTVPWRHERATMISQVSRGLKSTHRVESVMLIRNLRVPYLKIQFMVEVLAIREEGGRQRIRPTSGHSWSNMD